MRPLWRDRQVGEVLGCGRSKVYELTDAGLIESVKIGGSRRWIPESVEVYVNRLRSEQNVDSQ